MNITEALLGEHGAFYAQFRHLEQVVPQTDSLTQVQSQVALLTATLDPHAMLEDELLFSALDPHIGPMGPLTVMRMEHDEIKNTLGRIQEVQELGEAQELVLHVIRVAREHFAKEEQILFPIANQVLGEETLSQLGAQWAQRRGVLVAQDHR